MLVASLYSSVCSVSLSCRVSFSYIPSPLSTSVSKCTLFLIYVVFHSFCNSLSFLLSSVLTLTVPVCLSCFVYLFRPTSISYFMLIIHHPPTKPNQLAYQLIPLLICYTLISLLNKVLLKRCPLVLFVCIFLYGDKQFLSFLAKTIFVLLLPYTVLLQH